MYFKINTYEKDGFPIAQFDYQVGTNEYHYTSTFVSNKDRFDKIDETKYIWIHLNIERVLKHIKILADELPDHYIFLQESIKAIQDLVLSYTPGTHPKVIMSAISDKSEDFYKVLPPKDHKYYKGIKSMISALVLYCEINNV